MPAGIAFWVLMIVWFCLGLYGNRADFASRNYPSIGGTVLEFVLFLLLGWRLFGPPLQ